MNNDNKTDLFRKSIKYTNSKSFWILGLFAMGIIFLFVGAYLGQKIFDGNPPDIYWSIVFSFSLLWQIGSATLSIFHREIPRPGISSIRGSWAVIVSSLALVILLLGEIFFIYSIVIEV